MFDAMPDARFPGCEGDGRMSDELDLTEKMATAAADAVRARRGAIESAGAGALRGITIEIEPANRGAVLSVETFLAWRQTMRTNAG
jgi:hypothetical protein